MSQDMGPDTGLWNSFGQQVDSIGQKDIEVVDSDRSSRKEVSSQSKFASGAVVGHAADEHDGLFRVEVEPGALSGAGTAADKGNINVIRIVFFSVEECGF